MPRSIYNKSALGPHASKRLWQVPMTSPAWSWLATLSWLIYPLPFPKLTMVMLGWNSREQGRQNSSTSAVSRRSGTVAQNSATAHRKDELPRLPLHNKTANLEEGQSPTLARDVCAHPITPAFLWTASGCCDELRHYKKTVWRTERQPHIQITQQNRDLSPNSRVGMQTIRNKHKNLLNGAGCYWVTTEVTAT